MKQRIIRYTNPPSVHQVQAKKYSQKPDGWINEDRIHVPFYCRGKWITDKNGNVVSEKLGQHLGEFAKHCLSHPWSNDCVWFYTKKAKNGEFICKYTCVVFDTLDIKIHGRGKTPQEAEKNCNRILNFIEHCKGERE